MDLYDETLRGSQLNAKGDINLQAAKDITLSASTVQTDGALKLAAGGDVTLTTQTEQHDELRIHTGKKKGLASTTTTHTEDSISQTLALGSMLSAGSIDVSGKNIAVTGSHVVADGSAVNTAVTPAKAASEESNGRLAAVNASDQNVIGISLSYGSQSSKSEQTVNQTTHQGSTLTAGNNLNITATGNGVKGADGDIVLHGSQLQMGKDTSLTATIHSREPDAGW
ncbi:putative adhesin/hemolysin precursor [Yersinia intermedia]|nr:putative adhesin/hemolysin precursor [Yersinia intermedia]